MIKKSIAHEVTEVTEAGGYGGWKARRAAEVQ